MKPLTLLLMALFLGPSVGASPSGEEFLVEDITEIRDAITIQDVRTVAPVSASSETDGDRLSHSKQADRGGSGSRKLVLAGFYGRTAANGERFRKGTLTAARRKLPFGTKVRVTNLNNGRSVVVRINDRGPFRYHRVIDLAHGAASQLQMMQAGEVPVKLEILTKGD